MSVDKKPSPDQRRSVQIAAMNQHHELAHPMRTKHVLWRVKNGWIRTPDVTPYLGSLSDAASIMIFEDLFAFARYCEAEGRIEQNKEKVRVIALAVEDGKA